MREQYLQHYSASTVAPSSLSRVVATVSSHCPRSLRSLRPRCLVSPPSTPTPPPSRTLWRPLRPSWRAWRFLPNHRPRHLHRLYRFFRRTRHQSYRRRQLRLGRNPVTRYPNPNYPNLDPIYPYPNYPITDSDSKSKTRCFVWVIRVTHLGTGFPPNYLNCCRNHLTCCSPNRQ
jgi:hypothetical protein